MDINKYNNIIDTRDIKERIEELESDSEVEYGEYEDEKKDETVLDYEDWYKENEIDELETLRQLYEECKDVTAETEYGETLVRYSYFADYVQEFCEECGYISKDFPFWIELDWDRTAENVKQDYSIVDFDGIYYYIRSC